MTRLNIDTWYHCSHNILNMRGNEKWSRTKLRDAGKKLKKKKNKQESLRYSATFVVIPTAFGDLLKYVDRCPSQHRELTVFWKTDPLPKASTTLRSSRKPYFGFGCGSGYIGMETIRVRFMNRKAEWFNFDSLGEVSGTCRFSSEPEVCWGTTPGDAHGR